MKELYENSRNSLIVAYGCSGTGKSHTIHGTKNDPGLMENIFQDLFQQINNKSESSSDDNQKDQEHMIFLSYIEIYNERIYDLLDAPPENSNNTRSTNQRIPLKLKFDKCKKPCVDGLKEIPIRDISHAREVLNSGNAARQSASTAVNHVSSRSHALLTIKLVSMPKGLTKKKLIKNPEKYLQLRKLTVVDMAGNERSKRTLVSGARLKETSNINKSLMIFRNCIEALKSHQQSTRLSQPLVVPFRESKLTTLLKEFLVGNGKTTMIVCASPCGCDYDETINSLKFSSIAKEVRTIQLPPPSTPKQVKSQQTKSKQPSTSSKQLTQTPSSEVIQLRKQLQQLQSHCVTLECKLRKELSEEYSNVLIKMQEEIEEENKSTIREIEEQSKEDYLSELEVISEMNEIYQNQVQQILEHPNAFKSLKDDDEDITDHDDQIKKLTNDYENKIKNLENENFHLLQKYEEIVKQKNQIQLNLDEEQQKLISLTISTNSDSMIKETLEEEVESLKNKIEQLKHANFNDKSEKENQFNEISHQLEDSKAAQVKLQHKVNELDDDNKRLLDQVNDLKNLLSHKRKELKDLKEENENLSKSIPQPSTPSHTPTRNNTTHRTIGKVVNYLTPSKSGKNNNGKHIPTSLIHNDSCGNVQTWQGEVNPSLTGDGVSVQFNNVQNLNSVSASSFIHKKKKNSPNSDEITTFENDELPNPNVISSPSQILMKPAILPDNNDSNLNSVMIPIASDEFGDDEFAEQLMHHAFTRKSSKSNLKKDNSTNKNTKKGNEKLEDQENIENCNKQLTGKKRKSTDNSFIDIPLSVPPKKKPRVNTKSTKTPAASSKRTKTATTTTTRKTRTGTRTVTTRMR